MPAHQATRGVALNEDSHNRGDFHLHGKSVVVTGGARGIGRAVASLFAARGAAVHILDIDLDQAAAAAKEINDAGGRATSTLCDVSDKEMVDRCFTQLHRLGRIHVLVNSAGIAHVGSLESTEARDFEEVYRVNVRGVFHCMQAVISHMKKMGGGVILNLSSIAASMGVADRFAYSASKGAVLAMTYSVAKDYLGDNIRCNCISPARVRTPFVEGFVKKNYPGREDEAMARLAHSQPIGRMAEPEEVANLALFLCSDAASFVTGTEYPFDGGFIRLRG